MRPGAPRTSGGRRRRSPDLEPGITSPGNTRGHRHQPPPRSPDPARLKRGIPCQAGGRHGPGQAGLAIFPESSRPQCQAAVACHMPIRCFAWWAVQDLNLWPLPCQGSPGRFRVSLTVGLVEPGVLDLQEHSECVALSREAAGCVGSHFWLPGLPAPRDLPLRAESGEAVAVPENLPGLSLVTGRRTRVGWGGASRLPRPPASSDARVGRWCRASGGPSPRRAHDHALAQ